MQTGVWCVSTPLPSCWDLATGWAGPLGPLPSSRSSPCTLLLSVWALVASARLVKTHGHNTVLCCWNEAESMYWNWAPCNHPAAVPAFAAVTVGSCSLSQVCTACSTLCCLRSATVSRDIVIAKTPTAWMVQLVLVRQGKRHCLGPNGSIHCILAVMADVALTLWLLQLAVWCCRS